MNPRSPLLRPLALATLGWFAAGSLTAQNMSPFMPPPSATATAAPTAGAPLQYRGFTEDSSGVRFRIVDPAKKAGTWLKVTERDTTFDVTVKQSAADYSSVTVEHQGRTLTLALPDSKVASSGSASQPPPPVAPPPQMANVPPAVTQAVVVNPTPADEQRRLQAVADEVARRRALREQAQQQMSQGSPPGVQPAPQPGAPQNAPGQPRRP